MTNVPSFTDHSSPDKQALLAMLLEEAGEEFTPFPLSFAQQRLWFLNQLDPDSSIYNMPIAVRLQGALSHRALHDSLDAIIERHESLRTTFTLVDEQPIQVIAARGQITIREVDLSHLAGAEQEAATWQMVTEEARQPFDLAQGPLLRALLLRLHEQEHVLLLTLHHIIADGWSLGILVRELAAFYEASITGQPLMLTELEIQYADFAQWQRDELQGEFLESQLAYWKSQLAGQIPVLDLPVDHSRPPSPTSRGARQPFTIHRTLTESLKMVCRREGVTPFMALLAILKTVLYRYTNQTDLLIGTPIANRNQEAIEHLIGFFANTLVLRTDLSNNPTFRELLHRVRDVALSAYEYQDIPFEKLVEELQPERSLSHNPLFQVMFVLQNAPMPTLRLPELTLSTLDVESGTAKFDLLLAIHETEDGLQCEIEYSTELFEAATIARLAGHFQTLLAGALADPDQRLAELPLLTTAEQHTLQRWNTTQTASPRAASLHQLFTDQAVRTPTAIAVAFAATDQGDALEQITYLELDRRSNQLAHYLRGIGVGPDVPVGVGMDRSIDRMVGLLGVLKAGGAYLPLDLAHPRERLALVLRDSGAPVVLTQQALRDQLPAAAAVVLCLDQAWPEIAAQPTHAPQIELASTNLAYIIYTSGSTGQPKGVSIDHHPLTNLVAWQRERGLLPEALRTVQFAAPTFDVSLQEIFTSWATGSTLFLTDADIQRDAERLLDFLSAYRIERLFMPFVALQQLADMAHDRELLPAQLREIITAGEQLHITPRIAELFLRLPHCQLYNHYGPTESHVVTAFPLDAPPDRWPALPPIGHPITNTQIYLLDNQMRQVPVSVPGQLYIGGDGLARGYLNRAALTAETFVPDPFNARGGARLYRTGDLARYRADGAIEFLGRIDHQVKLRGFRVELGEIEAALRQHPQIHETAVVVREDEPGMKQLVAYVVGEQRTENGEQRAEGQEPGSQFSALGSASVSELRAFLQDRLPEYMLPSVFVWLDALPLTRHGKVDRRALPAPTHLAAPDTATYVAPRTPVEEILAGIWGEILRRAQVGAHDNFFALGGHSLLAAQVVTRMRRSFAVDLPLRALFEAPTVAELAQRISAAQQTQPLPPIHVADRDHVLPLSFAQERLWFLDQMNPGSATYNLPCYMRVHGTLDRSALERSLNAIVARHESLRTAFLSVDGRPAQVVEAAAALPITLIDLRHIPADLQPVETQRVIQADAAQPFNIRQSPLLRVTLIRLDEQEHLLLLMMHHIVSDAWSLDVLLNELATLYTAFTTAMGDRGLEPLPALPIQYADYAVWQRQWLQGPLIEQQLGYWQAQLRSLPTLDLPADRPRPPIQTFHGATYSFDLPRGVSDHIRALSRQGGTTLFMTLLGVWQTLLYRYADQDDFAIGTPVGNRSRAEIEGLIGFFVNMLVLRADLSGNPSFRELLGRVRETALQAYAHQDLPFEKLVEQLQPERDMSRSPLFQVMFALNQAPALHQQLPNVTMSPLAVGGTAAKVDLTLWMTESGDDLSGMLEYNVDLFDAPTIKRMAGHFLMLLEGILADPDRRVADLALLADDEREHMLRTWNATEADYPQDACIHDLIETQAARTPDAVAVIFRDQRLSYRELSQRADHLADHLRARGVRPGVFVGIHLERSIEMLVAILGVLKAGGAYLPLDPSYPQERLAFMVEDAQVAMVLTQQRIAQQLRARTAAVIQIDTEWSTIAQTAARPAEAQATPHDLAYVIYTSGSTGKPKGVMVPHTTVVNFFRGMDDQIGTDPGTWLAVTSISFDISVLELLWTLARGFEVVIQADPHQTYGTAAPRNTLHDQPIDLSLLPSSDDAADGMDYSIAAQMERYGVTHFQCTPALARMLAAEPEMQTAFGGLQMFALGGEAFPLSLVEQLGTLVPGKILNLYGPTETTIWSTAHVVTAADGSVPIGRPIANTTIYILDRRLCPVPVGVPGELYIGGAGVVRGYLQRPALTAERFVPDPFSADSGARLYRTGDRGRWLPDGTLDYLGRVDFQVKLRGYRIELGEIESALRDHPSVREAVAMVRETRAGHAQLVAYVVGELRTENGGPGTESREPGAESADLLSHLRQLLSERLPAYMVPSAIVVLQTLPLTPNGKIDRQALPLPDDLRETTSQSAVFELPQTDVETTLAQIWADILGVKQVGRHDNFFALGGDSILSIQIVARSQQVGLHFTPGDLFQNQTIAQLARVATVARDGDIEREIAPGPVPLTPIQRQFFEQQPAHFNQSLLLELRQPLDFAPLSQALHQVVQHHEAFGLRFVRNDRGWQQINPGEIAPVSCQQVDLAALPRPDQQAALEQVAAETQTSFDLAAGPLVRAVLFNLGADQPQRLLLVAHHLVVDDVSWRILLDDLQSGYSQLIRGSKIALPTKTTAFQRWAEELSAYAQSEAAHAELSYWRQVVDRPRPALPLDDPHGANLVASTREITLSLTADETRALLQDVPPVYHTEINDVLLTALAQGVAAWTGQTALLLDLEDHGRAESLPGVDLSRTIGWFSSVFPAVLELPTSADPGAALRAVKEQLRLIPRRGIGYGVLCYLSQDARIAEQLRSGHDAQISFNYLDQIDPLLASSFFDVVSEASGPNVDPQARRPYLLEISGIVSGGQLCLRWLYSEQIHRRATIQGVAEQCMAALRAIINHCLAPEAGGFTPSDFPAARVNQKELDKLFGMIGKKGGQPRR